MQTRSEIVRSECLYKSRRLQSISVGHSDNMAISTKRVDSATSSIDWKHRDRLASRNNTVSSLSHAAYNHSSMVVSIFCLQRHITISYFKWTDSVVLSIGFDAGMSLKAIDANEDSATSP